MLSPPRPSAPPSPLLDVTVPHSPPAPLTYLSAVHSLIHPARGTGATFPASQSVPGKQPSLLAALLPPPEWPFSLLALSLAATSHQLQIAQPLSVQHPSARNSPSSSHSSSSSLTAGDVSVRSYLQSPRSSVGQCVSWLMAAEHRVILHTTATFYTQTQQQQLQSAHPTVRAAGKPSSAASRRALQAQSAATGSEVRVAEVRAPLLLGVGPGSADSNVPRDGEVLVADEQPLTRLRPHASSLWLQPARLSRQLTAALSSEKPPVASQSEASSVMSSVTAAPIDVWAVVCDKYRAGHTGELCSLLGVEKIANLSQLSRLLAPHIQPLPPPPVIPPTALMPSAANSPMLDAMQSMTATRAAAGQPVTASAPLSVERHSTPANHTTHTHPQTTGHSPHLSGAPSSDVPTTRRGFMAAMQLSAPLSRLLGHRFLSRPSVVRHLWNYIRSHNLQRPSEKRIIDCDPPLQAIMGTRSVTMFEMNTFLTQHLTIVKDGDVDWIAANREAQEVEDRDREEDERTGKKKAGDTKKRGDATTAAAKKRERERAAREKKKTDRDDKRHRAASKEKERSRERDRTSSRKRERDRGREQTEKRKKQKKRRKEAEAGKEMEWSEGEDGAGGVDRVAAAMSGTEGGEREELTDDDSIAADDEQDRGEVGVEAEDDLSTQSEASSDENGGEPGTQQVEPEEATEGSSMFNVEPSSQGDDDEDDTGQSADDKQDDENDSSSVHSASINRHTTYQ